VRDSNQPQAIVGVTYAHGFGGTAVLGQDMVSDFLDLLIAHKASDVGLGLQEKEAVSKPISPPGN
jgi:hypothetical protein